MSSRTGNINLRGSDFIFDCAHLLHYQKMPKNLNEVDHM